MTSPSTWRELRENEPFLETTECFQGTTIARNARRSPRRPCFSKDTTRFRSAGPREEDAATFIARAHPRKWREKGMSKSREDAEAGDPERAGESTKNGETGACPSTRNRALTTKTARAKTGDWRVRGNRSQTETRGRKRQRSEARGANRFFSSCGRTDSEGRASSLETKARCTFSRPSSTCLFRLVPSSRAVVR
uniref:Pyruvate dehydrogenase complex subunit PDH-E3II n=1 Tax=Toxoplasma gondii TgCATBr9 TaxID=943120 RepID=A0A2T6IK33_TOXGO|nr:pyruvate dehydrogenase complex subunit PDH-E3II [Toxoplasma gondii TgCATBr9]